MPKFYITFDVDGATQTILLTSNRKIRAGSKNYWYAKFNFLDDYFTSLEYLSASFSAKPYSPNRKDGILMPIVDNECKVPWEMLTKKRKVYIGVFAGDMMVTNEAIIEVTEAAVTAGIETEPTKSWYDYFEDELEDKQDKLTAGENINIDEDNIISADLSEVVKFTSQDLHSAQKLQARENIGAGTEEVFVVEVEEAGRGDYVVRTLYPDLINAINDHKTLWAHVVGIGIECILHNFKEVENLYSFWDIFPIKEDATLTNGELRLVSFLGDTDGRRFINCALQNVPLVGQNQIKDSAVLYTDEQNLTSSEKFQARENIGAGTGDPYIVDFNITNQMDEYTTLVEFVDYDGYIEARDSGKILSARLLVGGQPVGIILSNYINMGQEARFYDLVPYNGSLGEGLIEIFTIQINGESGWFTIGRAPIMKEVPTKVLIERNGRSGQVLEPNKVYYFNANITSTLNLTLGPSRDEDTSEEEDPIYHFYINTVNASNPITISLPSTVGYAPGAVEALTAENTIIEVTISKIPPVIINGHLYNYLAYANYMEMNLWD